MTRTPSPSLPAATVVICAYTVDRWPDLLSAVESARGQSHVAHELIVVIDRNDELLARAQAQLTDIPVIANAKDGGISGARNTGIARATGDIVVFLDDDAIAEPDWLEKLLDPYSDPTVLGVGGQILPLWRFGKPGWFPSEFNWVVGCSYTGLPTERSPVRNPIGANLSARRDVLLSVGGFSHSMGRVSDSDHQQVSGTADETELCIRASQRWPGHQWIYEPAARVHHVVPESRLSWNFFVDRCRMEGTAKALLSDIAGRDESLASERVYVRQVLVYGVLREFASGLRGDRDSLGRAAAIAIGLLSTAGAYAIRRASRTVQRARADWRHGPRPARPRT